MIRDAFSEHRVVRNMAHDELLAKLDEFYPKESLVWIALHRQVEKHIPDRTKMNICIGCSKEWKEQEAFSHVYYPCTFITEVATDLGIDLEKGGE